MTRNVRSALLTVSAVHALLALPALSASLSVATHSAIFREGETAWLLRTGGSGLDKQTASNSPRPAIEFHEQNGIAFRWPRQPSSFTRWAGGWLIANGTRELHEFSANGVHLRRIPIGITATDIVGAKGRIWIYSAGADATLQVADDKLRFKSVSAQVTREGLSSVQKGIDAILVLAGGQQGDLMYTHLIGPPTLYHVSATGQRPMPLAYRRTSRRASLTGAAPDVDQLAYSSPARDIVAISAQQFLVLRNLEDEPRGDGATEPFVGRRADLYRATDGAHVGTATFPEPTRWLLRISRNSVIAIARSGRIVEANLGPASPGAVLK